MIATPDNWVWHSFRPHELACQHTGEHGMTTAFMNWLQALRDDFGHPMVITSGYRHPTHPIEARKSSPGTHSLGCAVDVACSGALALYLVEKALAHNVRGLGIQQKGGGRFIHLDLAPDIQGRPRPHIWSY